MILGNALPQATNESINTLPFFYKRFLLMSIHDTLHCILKIVLACTANGINFSNHPGIKHCCLAKKDSPRRLAPMFVMVHR